MLYLSYLFDDQWLAKKKESLNERAGALGDWVKGSLLKDMYKKDDKMTTAEQRKAKSAYVVQDASFFLQRWQGWR